MLPGLIQRASNREEHDLQLVRENETERSLISVHCVEVVNVPILQRSPRILLVVLNWLS